MKKRMIAMLLALLMLGTLVACGEEEYGEFYTEDDLLQNTLIQCAVTKTGANEISFEIHNKTPYWLLIQNVDLHVYQDGAWEKSSHKQGYLHVDRGELGGWHGTYKEVHECAVDFNYYKTIHPGEYRIIVKMEAKKSPKADEMKQIYATAYFTVTDEVYGVFTQQDGILQNSLVTLRITNYDMSEPLLVPTYHLENKSAFNVEAQRYAEDENYQYRLEFLENGEWKPCPSFGEIVGEGVDKKDFWKKEQIKNGFAELMDKRYMALEAGEYRMRVKYTATCGVDGVEIPEGQLEAVAYFTVTAPVQ